jgi:hypothetical protein
MTEPCVRGWYTDEEEAMGYHCINRTSGHLQGSDGDDLKSESVLLPQASWYV